MTRRTKNTFRTRYLAMAELDRPMTANQIRARLGLSDAANVTESLRRLQSQLAAEGGTLRLRRRVAMASHHTAVWWLTERRRKNEENT